MPIHRTGGAGFTVTHRRISVALAKRVTMALCVGSHTVATGSSRPAEGPRLGRSLVRAIEASSGDYS